MAKTREELALELEKAQAQALALRRGLHWLARKLVALQVRPIVENDYICKLQPYGRCPEGGCAECWEAAALYSTTEDDGLWMFLPARRARPRKARKA